MDTILQILQWALPSGGIGAAIAWIVNRKAQNAKTAKQVHDTYKEMYQDISDVLLKLQKNYDELSKSLDTVKTENGSLKRAINGLRRAIESINDCPYKRECPVRDRLQAEGEPVETGTAGKRQCADGATLQTGSGNRNDARKHGQRNAVTSGKKDSRIANRSRICSGKRQAKDKCEEDTRGTAAEGNGDGNTNA